MGKENENLKVNTPEQWMTGWDNYYKKALESANEKLGELMAISHPVQNLIRPIYGKTEGLKAIDIACGDGRTSCFLAKMGCFVDAIDALVSAVELTKKRAEALGVADKVNAYLKEMDGWEVEPESYDLVVATQCLQYLFNRAVPRLKDLAVAVKPGGLLVYSGNIPPHFETNPSMRFITAGELKEVFTGWTFHSIGTDEILQRPNDLRGYIWVVVQKPNKDENDGNSTKE